MSIDCQFQTEVAFGFLRRLKNTTWIGDSKSTLGVNECLHGTLRGVSLHRSQYSRLQIDRDPNQDKVTAAEWTTPQKGL